ncbi:MAG: PIN domain-containing protein [bacterium]|nr:PIN domain-containing protein [bacterium]
MNALVVDTSVWIEALRGEDVPRLESALRQGEVVLPPLALAELLSGVKNKTDQKKLEDFLSYVPLHPVGRAHWKKVGLLRAHLLKKGLTVSIPDCHIAQCALEMNIPLLTRDKIFSKMVKIVPLKIVD